MRTQSLAVVLVMTGCGTGLAVEPPDAELSEPTGRALKTDAPCTPGRVTVGPAVYGELRDVLVPSECRYIRVKAWGGGGIATDKTGGGGGFVALRFENGHPIWNVNGGTLLRASVPREAPGCGYNGGVTTVRYMTQYYGPLIAVAGGGGNAGAGLGTGRGGGGGLAESGQLGFHPDAGTGHGGGGATSGAVGAGGNCSGSAFCYAGYDGQEPAPFSSYPGAWMNPGAGGTSSVGPYCNIAAGMGGNGLYGGGGGGTARTSNNFASGGGGGGSSYAAPFVPNGTATLIGATWDVPGNAFDPDRGGAAWGGQPGIAGQSGRVVIDWSDVPFPPHGACTQDADCPGGEVCEGCGSVADLRCVPGCRSDADCATGARAARCKQVTCVACPCPAQCG